MHLSRSKFVKTHCLRCAAVGLDLHCLSASKALTRAGSPCGNGCVNMRLQHNEVGLKASNTRGCRGGVARMMLSTGQSKEAANRLSDRPLT